MRGLLEKKKERVKRGGLGPEHFGLFMAGVKKKRIFGVIREVKPHAKTRNWSSGPEGGVEMGPKRGICEYHHLLKVNCLDVREVKGREEKKKKYKGIGQLFIREAGPNWREKGKQLGNNTHLNGTPDIK